MIQKLRTLDVMPFAKVFQTENGQELCNATGYEALIDGQWWNEYEDSEGNLHYGR